MKTRLLLVSLFAIPLMLGACGDSVSKSGNNANNENNANNANNTNNANNSNNVNNTNNSNNANNVNNSNNANNANNMNNGGCEPSYDGTCGGVWCTPEPFAFVCTPGETLVCTCTTLTTEDEVTVMDAVNCSQESIHETANSLCGWELPPL